MPWSTPFEDPIYLPKGRQLITLQDAADFIMKLPEPSRIPRNGKPRAKRLSWQRKGRGPLMHTRVDVLRALNRNVERVLNTSRKDTHWSRGKLKRDR
jgi:hypothetical protein